MLDEEDDEEEEDEDEAPQGDQEEEQGEPQQKRARLEGTKGISYTPLHRLEAPFNIVFGKNIFLA